MRLALFFVLAVAGCSKSEAPAPSGSGHTSKVTVNKDPAKAKEMIAAGAKVIDVRTAEEYSGEHLESSTNMPLDTLSVAEVDKLTGGDKNAPVVLHCAKGGRAEKAKATLEAAGYTNVVNGGGLNDLK